MTKAKFNKRKNAIRELWLGMIISDAEMADLSARLVKKYEESNKQ